MGNGVIVFSGQGPDFPGGFQLIRVVDGVAVSPLVITESTHVGIHTRGSADTDDPLRDVEVKMSLGVIGAEIVRGDHE